MFLVKNITCKYCHFINNNNDDDVLNHAEEALQWYKLFFLHNLKNSTLFPVLDILRVEICYKMAFFYCLLVKG